MHYLNHNFKARGFTLIEMLIVVPFVMLVVASIMVGITVITTETLQVRVKTEQTFNTQDALNKIETIVLRALRFPQTTGVTSLGQGRNSITNPNDTVAWTSVAGSASGNHILLVHVPATNINPLEANRNILYAYKTGLNTCASGNAASNPPYPVTYIYFVDNGILYERVLRLDTTGTAYTALCNGTTQVTSSSIWQRGTCPPGNTNSQCNGFDSPLVDNVSAFKIYYTTAAGVDLSNQADPTTASGVRAEITTAQTVAGKDTSVTLQLYAQSVNIQN